MVSPDCKPEGSNPSSTLLDVARSREKKKNQACMTFDTPAATKNVPHRREPAIATTPNIYAMAPNILSISASKYSAGVPFLIIYVFITYCVYYSPLVIAIMLLIRSISDMRLYSPFTSVSRTVDLS